MLVDGRGVQAGDLPLLSVSKVVSNGIVGLFKETVICIPGSSLQELEDPKPVSQFQPEAYSKISANNGSHSFTWVFLKDFISLFLKRGEVRESEGEEHQCVVASHMPPTGDLTRNPGMCPDWESNW